MITRHPAPPQHHGFQGDGCLFPDPALVRSLRAQGRSMNATARGFWTRARLKDQMGLVHRWETRLRLDRGPGAALSHRWRLPSCDRRLQWGGRPGQDPRKGPRPPCAHAAAGDRPRLLALSFWAPTGQRRDRPSETSSSQTYNLSGQLCIIEDPKKHCHPVDCFTAFCLLQNIPISSRTKLLENNMDGREMSISMVKYFPTNSFCYICICLILHSIFITVLL